MTDPMTFDELSALYKDEMTGSLAPAREDLYSAMGDLLTRLRGECEKQTAIDPDSLMCEAAKHRRKSAERLCKEITRIRATKVCNMAFLGALGSRNSLTKLTEVEREYYYDVVAMTGAFLVKADQYKALERKKAAEEPEPVHEAQPPASPKAVQQTLPLSGLRQGLTQILRDLMAGRGWMKYDTICREVRHKDPLWEPYQIVEALQGLIHTQEVERYPPIVEGRRARVTSCEYRYKEGGA